MRSQLVIASLLLISFAASQEYPFDASLYDATHITVKVTSDSSVTLLGNGVAQSLQATAYYVPEEAGLITASPAPTTMNPLTFTWSAIGPGTYKFSYQTTVDNSVQMPQIKNEIQFPFTSPAAQTTYLQAQEITDTNDAIREQASSLAAGKTDSMEVVFSLAQWVQQNVKYDLTSVTSQASQKASWVMQNRIGVCDELTSLFMSMARDDGIPARFVSGIAYTNLPEFPDHWGPHGWAEVWLPDAGWIPVDVTYGQIGYVDATHIPISHTLDAKNTAIDYSLTASDLTMQTGALNTQATLLDKSGTLSLPIDIKLQALYDEVGSGSGDLLTATLINPLDNYVATDLYLATTADTAVLDKREQAILLAPNSERQVSWRVTLPAFNARYEYTVPFTVITQTAGNATTEVQGNTAYLKYPVPPSAASGTYSLALNCTQPAELYLGETAAVQCTSPGSTICTENCSTGTKTVDFTADQAGAFPIVVHAKNGFAEGSAVVTFLVVNKPNPIITASLPQSAKFDDALVLTFSVATSAMSDATVSVAGPHFSHYWNSDTLEQKKYELRFPANYLDSGNNTLTITVEGKDKNGADISKQATVDIAMQATVWQRFQLFFIHLFS